MTSRPLGLFAARKIDSEEYTSFTAEMPNIAAGDDQFLDPVERVGKLRIRPMLDSERTPNSVGQYPAGASWLIFFSETGRQLRAIVKLPFGRRKNTPSNIALAVDQVEKHHPGYGLMFRVARDGVDPFQATFVFDTPEPV
jgi:hypothetical protein